MEIKITSCDDCPFLDSASGEYNVYCNHPDKAIEILQYAGVSGWTNWPKAELPEDVYEIIRKENGRHISDYMKEYEKENKVSLYIHEIEIEHDNNHDHITPEWCPLKKQSINITY